MEISVREIDPADVGRARELMLELHRYEIAVQPALGSAGGRTDPDFWEHYAGNFSRWHADERGFALVAVVDGHDAGFAFCTEREGLIGYRSTPRIGYIEDIVVSPDARGGGIGRALIDAARERFRERGYSHFELSSVPGNQSARDFYRGLGLETSAVKLLGDV